MLQSMTFLIINELTVDRRVAVLEWRVTYDALSGAMESLAVRGRRSESSLPLGGGGEAGPSAMEGGTPPSYGRGAGHKREDVREEFSYCQIVLPNHSRETGWC